MKKSKKKAPRALTKQVTKKAPAATVGRQFGAAGVLPLGDRVLVQPQAAEETTSFGLIIPDNAKEKPEKGTIVAVGPGRRSDTGELVPLGVMVGDKVMFSKYGFDEIKVAGVEYYILPESSILAVIK